MASMNEVVRVVSKETIKPSTPTPSHLSPFTVSLLDLFIPSLYVPIILFFDTDTTRLSESGWDPRRYLLKPLSDSECDHRRYLLKKSLSDALTHFYTLAGRIKDKILVDCNDEGVDYFETKVNGTISEFKNPDVLNQLLPPPDIISFGMASQVPLVVQVNTFDCGGIAISVCISHRISDAASISTFINGWASIARGATEILTPTFDSSSLFPYRPLPFPLSDDTGATAVSDTALKKLVTKRFIFEASKVSTLRSKIFDSSTKGPDSKYPTRVEAVSALLWKSLVTKSETSPNPAKPVSILSLAVNLRKRMDPPLPQESYGNILSVATAVVEKGSHSLEELVGHLRVALNKIDGDYVRRLQGNDDEFLQCIGETAGLTKQMGADVYVISSWCKFPFYECDFGWGKPDWVTTIPAQGLGKNGVLLMDTKDGEGIEAWVKLEEEDMTEFEKNENLLEFLSF